jgi:undecaprenyl diphosphate synthase
MKPTDTHPLSIGVIMDGNRRWAKAKGLSSLDGHKEGYTKLRELIGWAKEANVGYLTVYAFSTENWNRTEEEVGYLMNLFRTVIREVTKESIEKGIRLVFIGERQRLAPDMQSAMHDAEEATKECEALTLAVAFSYGGRQEIIDAINRIPKAQQGHITEDEFSSLLWTKDIIDPDLIIRTSGEERLSNFLPWQSVYSELFFSKALWPDFSKEEFFAIIAAYNARERRLGI